MWSVTKLGLSALWIKKLLISWYMRRGYEKAGDLTPFHREEYSRLTLLEDLYFVELEKAPDSLAEAKYAAYRKYESEA